MQLPTHDRSGKGRALAVIGVAVALIAVGLGGLAFWRTNTDEAAREAAAQGAEIGGPNMSDVEALFCPDGEPAAEGVDCSKIQSATPQPPPTPMPTASTATPTPTGSSSSSPSNASKSSSKKKPDSYYLETISAYCAGSSPGLCEMDCAAWVDYKAKKVGSDIVVTTIAKVNSESMAVFGWIDESEVLDFKPMWLEFWKSYCS